MAEVVIGMRDLEQAKEPGTGLPPSRPHPAGLTVEEAAHRLRRDGPNVLPRGPAPGIVSKLAHHLFHFFALMLWGAAALAFVADLPELGIAIVAVVLANALFAFLQEHRAERAASLLRDLLPRRATVLRDGHERTIDATELVVDDAVILRAGDRICADGRLVEVHGLAVDVSTLTGESVPEHPSPGHPIRAGTFVVEGEATAAVTATGDRTRLAEIASLTRTSMRPPSPLATELRRLVRTLAMVAVSVGVAFFVVGVLLGTPVSEGFLFAIGVTVALVPEGLLPTVTLTLALAAQRMAHRSALVRRLEAVETLGSTTFVCTDKTGTLTENRMSVVEAWTEAGTVRIVGVGYEPVATIDAVPAAIERLVAAATAARRCSSGRTVRRGGAWVAEGDPMEAAVDALVRRLGTDVDRMTHAEPVRHRFPFDPRRRRASVVTDRRVLVTGAPDSVLRRCRTVPAGAEAALASLTQRGLRVLAVAHRQYDTVPYEVAVAETDLELLALLALEDPPRPHAAAALAACREAGIAVAMVKGDHPATALAIAREVGLSRSDRVLLGDDLPDDDGELGHLLDRDGTVVARVTPEGKLRIARALQGRGHVVAMTGDGVNDGPALQQADIGVAMGSTGTDVAREAADLVLLDDDFATIVAAIEDGRATYANARRFLTYHLTDNVAELTPFVVWALSGGRFPLALTVLQILALDLGTDTLSAVALGAERPRGDTLRRPPAGGRLLDALVARRAFAVLGPTEAAMGLMAFVVTMLVGGWSLGEPFPDGPLLLAASGATFATVVVAQTANAFACRSTTRPATDLGWASNRLLLVAIAIEFVVTSLFLFVAPIARVLRHAPPTTAGWTVALLSGLAMLLADGIDKRLRRGTRTA
jgi:calcium-translocating P-type ATPase